MNVNPTALITGATSGIGKALAEKFAEEKFNLVLIGRREDRLSALKKDMTGQWNISVETLGRDLSLPQSPNQIFEFLSQQNIVPHTLVNNAGFGGAGFFAQMPLDRQIEMIQVNTAALVRLTWLFLEGALKRNRGGILNVASTAGFQPGPYMAVYYASKAFVLSFTEALSHELLNTGIAVSCLCPGATDTEFQTAAGMRRSVLFEKVMMSAEDVAAAGITGLKKSRPTIIPGWTNKLSTFGSRILPRKWLREIMGRVNADRSHRKPITYNAR